MRQSEELLQERLEQLEAGKPLEACLAGLPEDAADLLKLAAGLREVHPPAPDSAVVTAQRAALLRQAAKEGKAVKTRSPLPMGKRPARSWPGWLVPLASFSGAMVCLLVCTLVAMMGAGVAWWTLQGRGEAGVVEGVSSRPTSESSVGISNPQSATLTDVRGLVEVQERAGTWTAARTGQTVVAGQRVRTGALSSARLAFYDGSQAELGPRTEVSVDALDARLSGGPRTIVLTQWGGETGHTVTSAGNAASRYEVRTPTATGQARGTGFHVSVLSGLLTRFSVDEGSVAVTSLDATVVVVAGQATTVHPGEAPDEPAFRITGEGEVTQSGARWIIAGQTFLTDDSTVIVGNPQVGDWVSVEARLLADGTYLADRILLLHRTPVNRFTITGRVDAIGETAWTVAGQAIAVNDETSLEDGIASGDLVSVEGVILEGGTLLARHIRLVEDQPGSPFDFVGVVQDMAGEAWTISGITIRVNGETEIDKGIVNGDVVQVRGWIVDDGVWLARSIERAEEEEREFEFAGPVESIAPWVVAGISFETDEWTEIEAGIGVGERVRVKGRILEDGTWVADEIVRLDDDDEGLHVVLVGTVDSQNPWVVSGVPLVVDDQTVIEGDVSVGDLVRVEITISPAGTWRVTRITLLSETGLGCLYFSAVVVGVSSDQVELLNWPTVYLDDDVQVVGEIRVGSVVLVLVCVDDDGTVVIVTIIVIYQPGPEGLTPTPPESPLLTPTPRPTPMPEPSPPPTEAPPSGEEEKVTICHKPNSKNPHTITISRSALQAHLDHGDTIGPCR